MSLNEHIQASREKLHSFELGQRVFNFIEASQENHFVDNVDRARYDSSYDSIYPIVDPEDWTEFIQSCAFLYQNLEIEKDRALLVELIAFKCLGSKKVKLSTNTKTFWSERDHYSTLKTDQPSFLEPTFGWEMSCFDLSPLEGHKIKTWGAGIETLARHQYEYKTASFEVTCKKGDIAIDAGACWGDTSLWFSHCVGLMGKVFAFEAAKSSLAVFERNMKENPSLSSCIDLVPLLLSSKSDEIVELEDIGPGSNLDLKPNSKKKRTQKLSTVTIDDFVKRRNLECVDFMKMDIEGSEENALLGGRETISKCSPKLAISVYHKTTDFENIPRLIKSINSNYRFALKHHTIHNEETVLYARVD